MSQAEQGGEKLMGVKEVAQATGLPPSTIRYYDQQFAEYLGVRRGPGRRRLFTAQAVERLLAVQRMLKDEGLSLRQTRQALTGAAPDNAAAAPAPAAAEAPDTGALGQEVARLAGRVEELERRVADLKEIQRRTLALVDSLTRS